MKNWLRSLLLILCVPLLVVLASAAKAAPSCMDIFAHEGLTSKVLEAREGRIEASVLRISHEREGAGSLKYTEIRLPEGAKLSETEIFREPADLIIGVDATGNTKGHMYVVINGIRYDGRMFFAPATIEKSGWNLPLGLMIRYKEIPFETKKKLVEWMDSGETIRTPTCVASTCKLLFEVGDFQGPGRRYWFPDRMIRYLTEKQPLSDGNKKLPYEIYTINTDFKSFWQNLPTWKTVPRFFFKVLFDPYTWGLKKRGDRDLPAAALDPQDHQ